jgi:hypothetical protein
MKALTKIVVAVESALTTSVATLWNVSETARKTTMDFNVSFIYHPYQPLCIAFGVIAGIIGFGFLLYRWKSRQTMPQNYLEGFNNKTRREEEEEY